MVDDARAPSTLQRVALSVLTPSFQFGRFLPDCIDSVKQQRLPDELALEHVVVDGGSTDDTVDILTKHGDGLRWISEPDRGIGDAFNKAVGMASGEWISWLNADEFYLPGALGALMAEAAKTSADVVFGDAIFVDEAGRFVRLLPQHDLHPWMLRRYGPGIQTVNVLLRRSAVTAVGQLDPTARVTVDWGLYIRLADHGATFRHVSIPIGAFRVHGSSITSGGLSPAFEPEHRWFRAAYGVHPKAPEKDLTGKWAHRAFKLTNGSYFRQIRATRELRGADMRWFRSVEGAAACRRLAQRVYGKRS